MDFGVTVIDEKYISIEFDYDIIYDYVINNYDSILHLIQKVVSVDEEDLESAILAAYHDYLQLLAETCFNPDITIEKAMNLQTFFEFYLESNYCIKNDDGFFKVK